MKNILQKLHKIQAEIEHMAKDGRNTFQNYAYLSETQVTLEMKKLLDKHNVVFAHGSKITGSYEINPTSKGTRQFVTDLEVSYRFYDVDSGEFLHGSVAGQGSDTADKGVYKAITGAIKYIYMKNFLIPTGDDPENDNGAKKAQEVFGGTVVKPQRTGEKEKREELHKLLVELNNGVDDPEQLKKILKDATSFVGKDQKKHFCDDISKMSAKWLDSTIPKIKEAIAKNTPPEEQF